MGLLDMEYSKLVVDCDEEFQEKIVEATAFVNAFMGYRQNFLIIEDPQRTQHAVYISKLAIKAWKESKKLREE